MELIKSMFHDRVLERFCIFLDCKYSIKDYVENWLDHGFKDEIKRIKNIPDVGPLLLTAINTEAKKLGLRVDTIATEHFIQQIFCTMNYIIREYEDETNLPPRYQLLDYILEKSIENCIYKVIYQYSVPDYNYG